MSIGQPGPHMSKMNCRRAVKSQSTSFLIFKMQIRLELQEFQETHPWANTRMEMCVKRCLLRCCVEPSGNE